MPRTALSPDQIDDFRERLVEAASRLFARRGYDGVTLRAIAAELGCSPMTPYRYFPDKAAIFAAVRTRAFDRFADSQEAACAGRENALEALGELGRAYAGFAVDSPDTYRLMFELSQPDPEAYPEVWEAAQRSIAPLRACMARAIDAGFLEGDPDVLTHVFWSGVHGIVSLHLAGKLSFELGLDDLLQPVLSTLFRGNQRAPSEEEA
ncbi:MAG: TetR/AcrR family transcriptional regulator [Myxococcota bacterium]